MCRLALAFPACIKKYGCRLGLWHNFIPLILLVMSVWQLKKDFAHVRKVPNLMCWPNFVILYMQVVFHGFVVIRWLFSKILLSKNSISFNPDRSVSPSLGGLKLFAKVICRWLKSLSLPELSKASCKKCALSLHYSLLHNGILRRAKMFQRLHEILYVMSFGRKNNFSMFFVDMYLYLLNNLFL